VPHVDSFPGSQVEIRPELSEDAVEEVSSLLRRAGEVDDHHPMSEQKRLDLKAGGGEGFVALIVRAADGKAIAYAQLHRANQACGLEITVDPSSRSGSDDLRRVLLSEAIDAVASSGGGTLRYWIAKPREGDDDTATHAGFRQERDLLQMRVPLPLVEEPAGSARTAQITVRPFRPGEDEEAWLAVNRRAFADHPEQGIWEEADLLEREAEEWFDPSGFLICEDRGEIAGSCWTKVHIDVSPLIGEIYVISVDPDFQGRGLGRALTVAGLRWLAGSGASIGMLYVDGSNGAAVSMYRGIGFTVDHVDRCYIREVLATPSGSSTPAA